MMGLTAKQAELLDYLERFIGENDGVAPSFGQMCEAIGIKNKSGVHRLLACLQERGLIRRMHGRARAIEVVADMPGRRTTTEIVDDICDALVEQQPATMEAVRALIFGALR